MDNSKKNIILIGFIGTGKKSIGKQLATRIGSTFIDFKDLLKSSLKISLLDNFDAIPLEIHEETINLCRNLPINSPFVLSSPYYFPFNRINLNYLKQHAYVVLLQTPAKSILDRLANNPDKYQSILSLPDPLDFFQKWGEKYRPFYQLDADIQIMNYQKNVDQIVAEILDKINQKSENPSDNLTLEKRDFQIGMNGALTGFGSQDFCYLCKEPLRSLLKEDILTCSICNSPRLAFFQCSKGHFICFKCAMQEYLDYLQSEITQIKITNPEAIASKLMEHPKFIGNAHHVVAVVATSLLLSLYNMDFNGSIGDNEIKVTIPRIIIGIYRAAGLPGDFTVYYGINNVAIGVGIACSICGEATTQKHHIVDFANRGFNYCLNFIERKKIRSSDIKNQILAAIQAGKEFFTYELSISWKE